MRAVCKAGEADPRDLALGSAEVVGGWGWRAGLKLPTPDLPCCQSFFGWGLEEELRVHPMPPSLLAGRVGREGSLCAAPTPAPDSLPGQTLCFRVRKMIDVYKPDWCEVREDWSVYLFSPENK